MWRLASFSLHWSGWNYLTANSLQIEMEKEAVLFSFYYIRPIGIELFCPQLQTQVLSKFQDPLNNTNILVDKWPYKNDPLSIWDSGQRFQISHCLPITHIIFPIVTLWRIGRFYPKWLQMLNHTLLKWEIGFHIKTFGSEDEWREWKRGQ